MNNQNYLESKDAGVYLIKPLKQKFKMQLLSTKLNISFDHSEENAVDWLQEVMNIIDFDKNTYKSNTIDTPDVKASLGSDMLNGKMIKILLFSAILLILMILLLFLVK